MSKSVRMDSDLHRALKLKAAESGRSMEELVDAAVTLLLGTAIPAKPEKAAESARGPSAGQFAGQASEGLPDGRWRLEGVYQSETRATPFYKIVKGGVVRWEDDDCEEIESMDVIAIEHELSKEKSKLKLKEIEE